MVYFNIKTSKGVETVDSLDLKDFESYKDFKKEIDRLTFEYRLCGMNVYTSPRCTNKYRNK